MDNEYISLTNTAIINYDDYGKPISKTQWLMERIFCQ
jgi:hypothetical protein